MDLEDTEGLIFGDTLGDDHLSPIDALRRGGILLSPRLKLKDQIQILIFYIYHTEV